MKMKQFVGPFNNTLLDLNLTGATIIQIGIECPRVLPWAFDVNLPIAEADITIDGKKYIITERQILEWENLTLRNPEIVIKNTSPYVIIDIAYE